MLRNSFGCILNPEICCISILCTVPKTASPPKIGKEVLHSTIYPCKDAISIISLGGSLSCFIYCCTTLKHLIKSWQFLQTYLLETDRKFLLLLFTNVNTNTVPGKNITSLTYWFILKWLRQSMCDCRHKPSYPPFSENHNSQEDDMFTGEWHVIWWLDIDANMHQINTVQTVSSFKVFWFVYVVLSLLCCSMHFTAMDVMAHLRFSEHMDKWEAFGNIRTWCSPLT